MSITSVFVAMLAMCGCRSVQELGEIKSTSYQLSDISGILRYDEFSEGLAGFNYTNTKGERRSGFIDKSGSVVIAPKYQIAFHFSGGIAKTVIGDTTTFIDKKGQTVFSFDKTKYPMSDSYFSDGLLKIQNNKYIYI